MYPDENARARAMKRLAEFYGITIVEDPALVEARFKRAMKAVEEINWDDE